MVTSDTMCIRDMNYAGSPISHWKKTPAPDLAKRYWRLKDDATVYDVVMVVRGMQGPVAEVEIR